MPHADTTRRMATTHLHERYARRVTMRSCSTVCGLPCDSVVTLYRDLIDGPIGDAVTCQACLDGLPNDRPGR